MKTFLITIKVNDPYPKEFSFRQEAVKPGTAIRRALRDFRKNEWKHKTLKRFSVNIIQLN